MGRAQEFQGRNSNGWLDDWSYGSRLGTQCYVSYLPPIKTSECMAQGGFAIGRILQCTLAVLDKVDAKAHVHLLYMC